MDTLVISDIHLYMHRRVRILNPINKDHDKQTVDEVYNRCTLQYIRETYEEVAKNYPNVDDLEVVFLGDIVDTVYVTEVELQEFNDLVMSIRHKVRIVLGNHDTSSIIPENKLKYSPLRFINLPERVKIVTDTDMRISEDMNTIYMYLSFTQKHMIYDKLVKLFNEVNKIIRTSQEETKTTKTTKIITVVLYTHNNIYMTDTLNEKPMYSLYHVYRLLNTITKKTLDESDTKIHLIVVNGHIHTSYYENLTPVVSDNQVNAFVPVKNDKIRITYLQLGSVSPTSFKTNPVASGISLLRESRKKSDNSNSSNDIQSDVNIDLTIYDNRRLVMLSVSKTNEVYLNKLRRVLDDSRQYECSVFLRAKDESVLEIVSESVNASISDDTGKGVIKDTVKDTVKRVIQDYSNVKAIAVDQRQ